MDTTRSLKLAQFKKALISLEEALRQEKSTIIRDSVIKRFEYTFELAWKSSKTSLLEQFGVEVFAPKECFRALRTQNLMQDEETEVLLKMTDDRNEVIHTYNEELAESLYRVIQTRYARLLRKLFEQLMAAG